MTETEPRQSDTARPDPRCNCIPLRDERHAPYCAALKLPEQWNVAPDGSGISHKVYDDAEGSA